MTQTARKTRVLLVDDSAAFRAVVRHAVSRLPMVEVAGEASGGKEALGKVKSLNPEVILLDRQMPEFDGLWVLSQLKNHASPARVIMLSGASHWSAKHTYEAMRLGAEDFLLKPRFRGSGEETASHLSTLLASAIFKTAKAPVRQKPAPAVRPQILVVGSSTGGPQALEAFFGGLPAGLPIPVVLVQHIPEKFCASFAERLSKVTPVPFSVAANGQVLEPGKGLLAPGGVHLVLKQERTQTTVRLQDSEPLHFCKPAVDHLFTSASIIFGPATMAVILTGMGEDGLDGARMVRGAGGRVLVQDEASSIVWGMPGAVAKAGLAEKVLPPQGLAKEIWSCLN